MVWRDNKHFIANQHNFTMMYVALNVLFHLLFIYRN